MKKQDVYEIIIKVFGLYLVWYLLINLLDFETGFFVPIKNLIVTVIAAYFCLFQTDKLMEILRLKDKNSGETLP